MLLSEIWIYPIKSLAGIGLQQANVLPKGLQWDRRFMLVDRDGIAITQRNRPELALFRTRIEGMTLSIRFEAHESKIGLNPEGGEQMQVRIWNDEVLAIEPDTNVSAWFSEILKESCRLVYFPEQHARAVDPNYATGDNHVSLADAYPLLVIGQASLDNLNTRLAQPVPMDRFRPNLVIAGSEAFAEDTWADFRVGSSVFTGVKPCARCVLTTVDQKTGVRGSEPLRTLSSYRTVNNKVYFGQNLLVKSGKEIKVGDPVSIDSYR